MLNKDSESYAQRSKTTAAGEFSASDEDDDQPEGEKAKAGDESSQLEFFEQQEQNINNGDEDECNSLPRIHQQKNKRIADIEAESSCYCSASHTDNLSTDEHDSLHYDTTASRHTTTSNPGSNKHHGLQASDSGADLTEYHHHGQQPNPQDVDGLWHKFWSHNGERLIWESWIGKYSAYINPDYLDQPEHQEAVQGHEDDVHGRSATNRILIRNLSGSDEKINITEVSDGWNPLSPVSIVDFDTEHLLGTSKCGSSSLRTVDSMTNVTRMTMSSIDLSETSKSSSFSSVSSVQSSLSSTSSEEGDHKNTSQRSQDPVEEDYENQWNGLWKKHYEEEFLKQYTAFVNAWALGHLLEGMKMTSKTAQDGPGDAEKGETEAEVLEREVEFGEQEAEEWQREAEIVEREEKDLDGQADVCEPRSKMVEHEAEEWGKEDTDDSEDDLANDEEHARMASMGLPIAFGGREPGGRNWKRTNDTGNAGSPNDAATTSSRKRVKAAFDLFGIEFQAAQSSHLGGHVQYKTKHIRLQNRQLRLSRNPCTAVNKHIRFDDDGNILTTENREDVISLSVLPDSSDDKLSSGDEEADSSVALNLAQVSRGDVTSPSFLEDNVTPWVSKRIRKRKKFQEVPPEIKENMHLLKFWHRRFRLFSKFDAGIKLDEESWYSVTPEQLAKHIANRCRCDVIVDGFCGAGGNSIQFAFTCTKVIAIDIDPRKIELARNNAAVYGVAHKIEFIVGDFFQLAPTLRADVVFFSPPWGGPSYVVEPVFDLETMLLPVSISKLLEAGRLITDNIAVFLPKNSNAFLLIDETKPGGGVEIEQNFMDKILVAITAYYNKLIKKI